MTHPNKARGNALERELCRLAEQHGLKAKRAWGSDGRSLGLAEDVDVVIDVPTEVLTFNGEEHAQSTQIPVQCKRRKTLPAYLQIPDSCKAVYFRQDRGPGLVLLRVDEWLEEL